MLTLLPRWVREATTKHEGRVEKVVVVSGVAQLLVDNAAVGYDIIQRVTAQALIEAPGLEVWGWLEHDPPAEATLADRLVVALRRHEQYRALLTPTQARNSGIPFSERCAATPEPASFTKGGVRFGDERLHLSPTCQAQAAVVPEAMRTLADEVLGEQLAWALLPEDHLDQGVVEDGWVAVIHADGNGFGQMFADLGDIFPDDGTYVMTLALLSEELDVVARTSLRQAVAEVMQSPDHARSEWLLPLIVGGDDLTAIVDARVARRFVEAYLRAFEQISGSSTTVSKVAKLLFGTGYLTACAGIAIVKPTHPFSQAYILAEALCAAAKEVKKNGALRVGAFDIQVVHESVGRRLKGLRSDHWQEGPFVTSDLSSLPAPGAGSTDSEWLHQHSAGLLTDAVDKLACGVFSRSVAHQVRTALTDGESSFKYRKDALVARFRLSPGRDDAEIAVMEPAAGAGEDWLDRHALQRGLTALDLFDVELDIGSDFKDEGEEAIR